jgi:hypothetical protein
VRFKYLQQERDQLEADLRTRWHLCTCFRVRACMCVSCFVRIRTIPIVHAFTLKGACLRTLSHTCTHTHAASGTCPSSSR